VTRATARVGGVKLAYYVRGAGPPVLFVMGLGGRASDWNDRFLAPLAARFTAVTFDNRGTGASDKPIVGMPRPPGRRAHRLPERGGRRREAPSGARREPRGR